MVRYCTLLALFELTLLAACVGLPTAQADPADDCCGDNRSGQCSGCIGGYQVDHGLLFGCLTSGGTNGCKLFANVCQFLPGPVQKYNGDCSKKIEINMYGASIIMEGCGSGTECS